MKYFFPFHIDAGNRGCQGITEGTAEILKQNRDNYLCLSSDECLDVSLGLSTTVKLLSKTKLPLIWKIIRKLGALLAFSSYRRRYVTDVIGYHMNRVRIADGIVLSTGGDMMCYSDNAINTIQDYTRKHHIKSILWGCSMGPENLTPEKEKTLKSFDLVYARESLTFDFFKSLGLNNVVCLPDPAFVLSPRKTELPKCFADSNGVLGLNISNYVLGGFDLDSNFGKQVIALIEEVLTYTQLHILLIPHVTWGKQDDRKVCAIIKKKYENNDRVTILNIENLSYRQIRFVISKCRFFIGARTHAVISAYSTCVPTIALGYSIKSRGIAKDLGLDSRLVVYCKNQDASSLLDSFMYLRENEGKIRNHLQMVIPEYAMKPYKILSSVEKI